jgi:hypothetical protein
MPRKQPNGLPRKQPNDVMPIHSPPLVRLNSYSSAIYDYLYKKEDKQDLLKNIFENGLSNEGIVLIEPLNLEPLIQLCDEAKIKGSIELKISDNKNGLYIAWNIGKTNLLHVSIHTGKMCSSNKRTRKRCEKKGNMHIKFDKLNVKPKNIKLLVNDDLKISLENPAPTNSPEANAIIINIIEILQMFEDKYIH